MCVCVCERDQTCLQSCRRNIGYQERVTFVFSTVLTLRILGVLRLTLSSSFADSRRLEVDRKIILKLSFKK